MRYTDEFLLYREPKHAWILKDMAELMDVSPADERLNESRQRLYRAVNGIVGIAERHGMSGNLWQAFLCYVLACHENPYSVSCEMTGKTGQGLRAMAMLDCKLFRRLFHMDIASLDQKLGARCACFLTDYRGGRPDTKPSAHVGGRMEHLRDALGACGGDEAFLDALTVYYKDYGVGKFGLFRAFKLADNGEADIVPIISTSSMKLDDLVGYGPQKKELIKNTEDFLNGQGANNVLLFGDSGTGKSSSIQAVLNAYWGRGLRMIEIYKHQFRQLSAVLQQIKERGYKFILYMDDLSFEDFETDYKYLKAVIEGGLETKPDNVLIYATSNRRHLIREQYNDRADLDDDLHRSETMQEKLSLAARFGLSIFYLRPNREEYEYIVQTLAQKHAIQMPPEELRDKAARWELRNGGMSGRTAQQFINYLLGKEPL